MKSSIRHKIVKITKHHKHKAYIQFNNEKNQMTTSLTLET